MRAERAGSEVHLYPPVFNEHKTKNALYHQNGFEAGRDGIQTFLCVSPFPG